MVRCCTPGGGHTRRNRRRRAPQTELPFPFEYEREQQAVLVAGALEDHIGPRDVHAIVLGDFDATPDSASLEFWRGRRPVDGFSVCYQDTWEYAHPDEPVTTSACSSTSSYQLTHPASAARPHISQAGLRPVGARENR